jgi:glycosyltransferase involved in cell wall biosynthesis
MTLSVIIIGRNEADHIERCLQSVLKGTQRIPDTEIIYVDSASTDRTLEIVRQYPAVRVLQLREEWPLSASAGRYIGYLHAGGTFLFFIDGDSVLYRRWLSSGIEYLAGHPDTGAVAGSVHEVFETENGRPVRLLRHRYGLQQSPFHVKTMGGIALYRKSVLHRVGPFNPFITADEEPELGLRMRRDGYTLTRLPEIMALTYGPERETFHELFRRYRSGLYSFGIALRYCRQNACALQYIRERLDHLVSYGAVLIVGLLILIVLIFRGWLLTGVLLLILSLTGLRLLRPGIFRRLMISFVKRSLMMIRTLESYFRTDAKPAETYPTEVTENQKGIRI